MLDEKLTLRAHLAPWEDSIQFCIFGKIFQGGDGKPVRMVGTDITMTTHDEFSPISPTFRLGKTEAQALMDNLWDCGLRPSEGSGSAGAMAATQKHLEDMRRLVFVERREVAP